MFNGLLVLFCQEKLSQIQPVRIPVLKLATLTIQQALLVKQSQPAEINKSENLQVLNGVNSGELEVLVNRVKGATAYLHEYTTDDTAQTVNWVSVASTSRCIVFSNLQSGSKYYCRVGAVGPKGQLVYSDPVSRIVI